MNMKEAVEKIRVRYKGGFNNHTVNIEGVRDTEGQMNAIHFQNRQQIVGAEKLLRILKTSRTLDKMLFGEEK